jgi:uncharacterized membrane protein (DUF373 family)
MTKTLSKDNLIILETSVAFVAFLLTLYFSKTHFEVSFSSIIGLILYFMIFIELTRALFDFILESEHKFKVRYLYDMGIIFNIREILVTITSNHHHIKDELIFLAVSTLFLLVLFVLRIIDAKTFKYTDKCNSCSHFFEPNK